MDRNFVAQKFYSDLTMQEVAKQAKCRQPSVKRVWTELYGEQAVHSRKIKKYRESKLADKNPFYNKKGSEHHSFRKVISDQRGYVRIHAPDWYRGPKSDGYAREHIVIYCESRRLTKLPDGLQVHHLDLDRKNNSPNNLIALSAQDHTLLHAWINKLRSAETIP